MSDPKTRATLRLLLGLALAAAAIYFASREISLQDLSAALGSVHFGWALLATAAAFIGQTAKVYRWRTMLSGGGQTPDFYTLWTVHMSSQLANLFIPARAGDIGRVVVVGGQGPGRMFTLGTLVLEKVIDLVPYSALIILALATVRLPDWLENPAETILAAVIIGGLMMGIGLALRHRLAAPVRRLLDWAPGNWGARLRSGLDAAEQTFDAVRTPARLRSITFTTFVDWAGAVLANYFMLYAFDLKLPMMAAVILLLVLQFGISVNLSPGSIGIFEYLCIQALALYGVSRHTAFSYGLVLHVAVLIPLVTGAVLAAVRGRPGAVSSGQ